MQRLNIDRVTSNFKARTSKIVANLHDYQVTKNPSVVKVICTFNSTSDRLSMHHAVAHLFNGNASPVEGSFRQISTNGNPAFVGFIAANREIKDYNEAEVAKMKVMASNLLMDLADTSLWQVKESGKDKYLCRHADEDLSELVVMARVHQRGLPAVSGLAVADINRSEYIAFVDTNTAEVRYGYVVAAEDNIIEVLPSDSEELETIEPEAVVESVFLNKTDVLAAEGVSQPSNAADKNAMLDYYKKLYSYNPDYYVELEKIIEGRSNI